MAINLRQLLLDFDPIILSCFHFFHDESLRYIRDFDINFLVKPIWQEGFSVAVWWVLLQAVGCSNVKVFLVNQIFKVTFLEGWLEESLVIDICSFESLLNYCAKVDVKVFFEVQRGGLYFASVISDCTKGINSCPEPPVSETSLNPSDCSWHNSIMGVHCVLDVAVRIVNTGQEFECPILEELDLFTSMETTPNPSLQLNPCSKSKQKWLVKHKQNVFVGAVVGHYFP